MGIYFIFLARTYLLRDCLPDHHRLGFHRMAAVLVPVPDIPSGGRLLHTDPLYSKKSNPLTSPFGRGFSFHFYFLSEKVIY